MALLAKKLIISADAGSLFDKVGRAIGAGLTRTLGSSVDVENVGNSNGVGGAEAGARAVTDGSTILICNKGAITSHPHTSTSYKTSDFAPLCQVAEAPIAVAVAADSTFATLDALLKHARKNPGTVSYSTPNPYHTQRLAMQQFASRAGLEFNFKLLPGGNAASIKQLTEGAVDLAFLAAHNLVSSEQSGEIKVLAVAHGNRLPFLPHVPTFHEQGYELITAIWLGLFAPVGVSREALDELRKIAEGATRDQVTTTSIEDLRMVPAYLNSSQFSEKISADTKFHYGVLRQLGAV